MSWEAWTHAQRYEFLSHLNQPHAGLDAALRERHEEWAKRGIDPHGPIEGYKPLQHDWVPHMGSSLVNDSVR